MNAELNTKMAEVMGLRECIDEVTGNVTPGWLIDDDGLIYKDWNPSENVDQALMAVDKIGLDFCAERSSTDKKYWVVIGGETEDPNVSESESLAEAICLAVIEADKKLKETKCTN